jgi:hypothetical protein
MQDELQQIKIGGWYRIEEVTSDSGHSIAQSLAEGRPVSRGGTNRT